MSSGNNPSPDRGDHPEATQPSAEGSQLGGGEDAFKLRRDGLKTLRVGVKVGFSVAKVGARVLFRLSRRLLKAPGKVLPNSLPYRPVAAVCSVAEASVGVTEAVAMGCLRATEALAVASLATSQRVLAAAGSSASGHCPSVQRMERAGEFVVQFTEAIDQALVHLKTDTPPFQLFSALQKPTEVAEYIEIPIQAAGSPAVAAAPRVTRSRLVVGHSPAVRTELWRQLLAPHSSDIFSVYCQRELTVASESVRNQITRDLPRTLPGHPKFTTEQDLQALFDVLWVYAQWDPEIGYCQGMNYIAAIFLLYLPPNEALDGLVYFTRCGMRDMFTPEMKGLHLRLWQYNALLGMHLPTLLAHLDSLGVLTVLFATSWFMTAFAYDFPPHFAARVFDALLADGTVVVLFKTAIGLLQYAEPELLKATSMEDAINYVKKTLPSLPARVLHEEILTKAWEQVDLTVDNLAALESAFHSSSSSSSSSSEERHPAVNIASHSSTSSPTQPDSSTLNGLDPTANHSHHAMNTLVEACLDEWEQMQQQQLMLQSQQQDTATSPEIASPLVVDPSVPTTAVSVEQAATSAAPSLLTASISTEEPASQESSEQQPTTEELRTAST